MALEVVEGCWTSLDVVGCCWVLLDGWMLDVIGHCWVVLTIIHSTQKGGDNTVKGPGACAIVV